MARTTRGSDMATGLGLLLGIVVVVASIGTATAAYFAFVGDGSDSMQLLSGLTLSVAFLAGCLSIVAIHLYG